MCNRLWRSIGALIISSALGTYAAHASESRINAFAMACDGATKTIVYSVRGVPLTGTQTNNFIQTGSVVISEPRGGLKFLRFQVNGHPDKTIAVLGKGEISTRADFTGFLQTPPSTSGQHSLLITGACLGGGTLTGFATVWFFD